MCRLVVPWDASLPSQSRMQSLLAANIRRNSPSISFDDEVQVVVPWDARLKLSLVYEPAFDIFSGKGHKSPPLDTKRDVLLNIVSRPSEEYFLSGTSQATDFEKLKKQCRAGWTSVSGRNRVWTMAYTAEKLALLLVLREQVDSENTSNRMHRNGLSAAAPAPAATVVKRVMKRAGDTFFGRASSPVASNQSGSW